MLWSSWYFQRRNITKLWKLNKLNNFLFPCNNWIISFSPVTKSTLCRQNHNKIKNYLKVFDFYRGWAGVCTKIDFFLFFLWNYSIMPMWYFVGYLLRISNSLKISFDLGKFGCFSWKTNWKEKNTSIFITQNAFQTTRFICSWRVSISNRKKKNKKISFTLYIYL